MTGGWKRGERGVGGAWRCERPYSSTSSGSGRVSRLQKMRWSRQHVLGQRGRRRVQCAVNVLAVLVAPGDQHFQGCRDAGDEEASNEYELIMTRTLAWVA